MMVEGDVPAMRSKAPKGGRARASNAPKLTAADIKTLVAWADSGSSEGAASDKTSAAPDWKDGWRIQPDIVVSMPQEYRVGASGARFH